MRSRIIRIAASIFVATLALSSATWAACSNASLTGTYGFLLNGTTRTGITTVALGQGTFTPGPRTFNGTETASVNGVVVSTTFNGTYSVSADCTGKATLNAQGFPTEHASFVVITAGSGVRLIGTDANAIQSGFQWAQGNAVCTNLGVKGQYGFQATGNFLAGQPIGPVAYVGAFTLDGIGGISGSESGSLDGQIFSAAALSGSYTINSDCTGAITTTLPHQSSNHYNLVVVNGGQTLMVMQTDANTLVTGTLQH